MLRLLLPGIRIKRWMLVMLAGMCVFGLGFVGLVDPHWRRWDYIWHVWYHLTATRLPYWVIFVLGVVGIVGGLWLVAYGTRRLIRAFTFVANPTATGTELLREMVERRDRATAQLRVVGLGGGTGLSTLLRGLKAYPVELTAIVTVSDDGGSSGRLRADLDMPPPGDIRHCLVALADAEPLMEGLFEHRFTSNGSSLHGHSLGNLIIAGLQELTGDFGQAIQEASRVLAVRGRVLPSASRALVLKAVMSDGREVRGETAITGCGCTIADITLEPTDITAPAETLQALREADVIVVGPGSVYTSLLPNLLIPGVAETIAASPAIKIFVCNVMTQPGESDGFSASRHLEALLAHLSCPNPFHYAIVNLQRPPGDVLDLYAQKGQHFVEPDLARIRAMGTIPLTGSLLAETHLARHDHDKLARCLLEHVAREARWPQLLKKRRQG
jgi:uncharacterized cofD-like protein